MNLIKAIRGHFQKALPTAFFLLSGLPASSFVLINGEGFEAFGYSPGGLEGQFASVYEDAGLELWERSSNGPFSEAVIQNSIIDTGDQALAVTRAPFEEAFWSVSLDTIPLQRFVRISWTMNVRESFDPGFGPFFGVTAFGASESGVSAIGAFGIDASTSDLLIYRSTTNFEPEVLPVFVDFDQWYDFEIEIDYGLQTFSGLLNGTPVFTQEPFDSALTRFDSASITTLAAGVDDDSGSAIGNAFFDNYLVEERATSVIPEPSPAAMTLLFGLAMLKRRSRS